MGSANAKASLTRWLRQGGKTRNVALHVAVSAGPIRWYGTGMGPITMSRRLLPREEEPTVIAGAPGAADEQENVRWTSIN
jgi:hypothetical protein